MQKLSCKESSNANKQQVVNNKDKDAKDQKEQKEKEVRDPREQMCKIL